ncbi:ABC transporter permease subunit [Chromatiaceae bacterium AAb-1]|nr:ABC transporter permease subunit [Chromatiaceae bacterium AAb-1]
MINRTESVLPDGRSRQRVRRRRRRLDVIARYSIGFAGISVMLALAAIFIYLFSQILPLLSPASIQPETSLQLDTGSPQASSPFIAASLSPDNQTLLALNSQQQLFFYRSDTGQLLQQLALPVPADTTVTAMTVSAQGRWLFGLSNGQLLLFSPAQEGTLFRLLDNTDRHAVIRVGLQENDNTLAILSYQEAGTMQVRLLQTGGDISLLEVPLSDHNMEPEYLLLDRHLRHLLVVSAPGRVLQFHFRSGLQGTGLQKINAELVQQRQLTGADQQLTALSWLAGQQSLVAATSDGQLYQWAFTAGSDGLIQLTRIRQFSVGKHTAAAGNIVPEFHRRGFITLDQQGGLGLYHATAGKQLLYSNTGISDALPLIDYSNQRLFLLTKDGLLQRWWLHNLHPEVSWRSLWLPVWYEGWQQPEYAWQSTGGSDDYEAKLSLVPLLSGTLKAAFFALLFAVPLAVMAAIYTAHFMAPALRSKVKPALEMMESLPTVILGFIAGLWLAPLIEQHLPAVLCLLLMLPLSILGCAFCWHRLKLHQRVKAGYEALILLPVIALTVWGCFAVSMPLEQLVFGDSLRYWLSGQGVAYDQRNALVVGIAMGFAVIPAIFSIAEDAVFNVPRHLYQGALALGATPWQALTRIVLPIASPGIFSAVMIGFGRALGETMIVLMATGNNPVTNFNLLEGLRSLAASLAIELPEAATGSTQFRILFLAAVLLFVFTFCANTLAELVRQRLRRQYRLL